MVCNQLLRTDWGVFEKPVMRFFLIHAEKYPGALGAGQSLSPCPVTTPGQLLSTHLLITLSFDS